jgi:transcriptional regulator with XRE-family HTH domain
MGENIVTVGERIKKLREEKSISLQELAGKTGYTSALINQIENHMVSPPLGALGKIASALDVKIGELWGEHGGEPFAIVRKDDRRPVSRFASKEGVSYGYSYESLGSGMKDRHIEPYLVTLEEPTVKSVKLSSHEGEEFLFVLSGEVEVCLGENSDILTPGDSIQFSAKVPHRVSSHGEGKAQIVAVIWSPEK